MIKFCFTKKWKLADRIQQVCLHRKFETKGKPGIGGGGGYEKIQTHF